jgi:hypothetical protein
LRQCGAEYDRRNHNGGRTGARHVAIITPELQEPEEDGQQSNGEDGRGDSGGSTEPKGEQRCNGADPDQPYTLAGFGRHATPPLLPIALARGKEIIRQRELRLTSSRKS